MTTDKDDMIYLIASGFGGMPAIESLPWKSSLSDDLLSNYEDIRRQYEKQDLEIKHSLIKAVNDIRTKLIIVGDLKSKACSGYLSNVLNKLSNNFSLFEKNLSEKIPVKEYSFSEQQAATRIKIIERVMHDLYNEVSSNIRNGNDGVIDDLLKDITLCQIKYFGVLQCYPQFYSNSVPRSPEKSTPIEWYVKYIWLKEKSLKTLCPHCERPTYMQVEFCIHCYSLV